jgi:small subunit ribosomal protein S6
MPLYENVFIARQDISAAQVEALADTFTGIVAAQGGQVTKREYWGLRNLAYRIKKNRKGHYILFNLDAPPPAVNELERNMRINEDVLRYITVRVEALEEGPSAVMQNRGRGEERDRDRDRGGRRGFGDRDRDRDRDREPAAQAAGEGGEE